MYTYDGCGGGSPGGVVLLCREGGGGGLGGRGEVLGHKGGEGHGLATLRDL
jgi:hypothetical protein